MPDIWVEADGLTKHFADHVAVNGIDLAVRRGEVLGFLGPNGAGKTTTMRMLTGYLEPSAGRVVIQGIEMERDPLSAKERMGYLPEGAPLYADMTPRQLLRFVADIRGMAKALRAARFETVVATLELASVLDQAIDTLSKGFKRRVGLAQAILHDPPILILDEPTDGLDPIQKQEVRQLIRAMAPEKAIIISTHILEEVEAVCTRAVIIAQGEVVSDGTPAGLLSRSKRHNRVRLAVRGAEGDKLVMELARLASVKDVIRLSGEAGLTVVALVPREKLVDLQAVSALAQANSWRIESLEVEKGDLDEVFIKLAGNRPL